MTAQSHHGSDHIQNLAPQLAQTPTTGEATLSIVIPTYGRSESLRDLLASIARQTFAPKEVIVVDQNPPELLDPIFAGKTDPALIRVRLEEPNAATARNAGFRAAGSTHVLFVDDDEMLEPDFAAGVMRTFARYPEVRCLWPVVYYDGDRQSAVRFWKRLGTGRSIAGSSLFSVSRAGGGGVAFEREFFRSTGGYDELMFTFGGMSEDWELSARMMRRGLTVWCDPSLFILHDMNREGGCGTRSLPYREVRTRLARACMFKLRAEAGAPFHLRLRDLGPIIRFGLLSSIARDDARREVLRHPIWHLRMLWQVSRESRRLLEQHHERYADPARVDHLS